MAPMVACTADDQCRDGRRRVGRRRRGTAGGTARRLRPLPYCAIVCAAAAALLGGCASRGRAPAMVGEGRVEVAGSGTAGAGTHEAHRRITRDELQQRLMAFADRYLSQISEATDQLKRTNDPARRLAAHSTKYYPATTVLTIAAEPDPEAGLLDMLTVVTLERMVWNDDGWAAEVFGPGGAAILRAAQLNAENDI